MDDTPDSTVLHQILAAITGMSDRIDSIEERLDLIEQLYEELTSVEPEDNEEPEDDGWESEGDTETNEYLRTIGQALQMILANQQDILKHLGVPGNQDD